MTVSITINGDDGAEFLRDLSTVARGLLPALTGTSTLPSPEPLTIPTTSVALAELARTAVEDVHAPSPSDPSSDDVQVASKSKRGPGRPRKAEEPKASAPEPEPPAVDPQDDADEVAEVAPEEGVPAAVALTDKDVLSGLNTYMSVYGRVAALEDGPKLIGAEKVSMLKPEQYATAVETLRKAIDANPYNRTPVELG